MATTKDNPWAMPPEFKPCAGTLIRGTCYFLDFNAAARYYKTAHNLPTWVDAADMVQQRLCRQEIHLGKPPLVSSDKLITLDSGTRWGIIE